MNTIAPLAKLIKSSIYVVNGTTARFIGESTAITKGTKYAFSAHGTEVIATGSRIKRASGDDIKTYFGR